MEQHTWTIFVITKYLIYELQYDTYRLKNMKDEPLKPDEITELVDSPPQYTLLNKDGSGSDLQIINIWQIKWIEFSEIFNENTLMLGFRANQFVNLKKEVDKNGKNISTILVDQNGDTLKTYSPNPKVVEKIVQERKTPEWALTLKQELINRHFDLLDKLAKKKITEIGPIQKGEYYLQILFESEKMAKLVQMALDKAK